MFIWSIFLMLFIVCCSSNRSTFSCIQNCVGDRQQFADITEITKNECTQIPKLGFLFSVFCLLLLQTTFTTSKGNSRWFTRTTTLYWRSEKMENHLLLAIQFMNLYEMKLFLPTITDYVISQLFGNFFHFPLEQLVFFLWWLLLAVVMVWQAAVACAFM